MDDPRAYKFTVARDIEAVDGIRLTELLNDGVLPEQAAEAIIGAPALKNAPKAQIAWCGNDCPTCEGTAWIDTGAGLAPCPERLKESA